MRIAVARVTALTLTALGIFPLALVLEPNRATLSWWPVARAEWLLSVPLVVGACLLLATLAGRACDLGLSRARTWLVAPSPRAFGLAMAACVATASVFFAWYCSGGQPTVVDEMSQQFQAHLLLHGRLWAHAPPHPEFFDIEQTIRLGGRWFSQFPIGGPALLAIADSVRMPWLINPVLGGVAAWATYRFCAQTMGESTARGVTLLFATSPFVLLMSASQMNHPGSLAFIMIALAALPAWESSDDPRRVRAAAALIGVAMGVEATIRPYDAALVAGVLGLFQIIVSRRAPMRRNALALEIGAGAIPVALLCVANWRTTGAALRFGYEALNGAGHLPGFHPDPFGTPFTPLMGIVYASAYLQRLSLVLLFAPVPALLLIVPTFVLARDVTRWDLLLVALIGAVLVGYAAYWYEGYYAFGPRFLFPVVPAFLVFLAKMPESADAALRNPVWGRTARLLIPVSVMIAWLPLGGPGGLSALAAVNGRRQQQPRSHTDISADVARAGLSDALVFIPVGVRDRAAARLRVLEIPPVTAVRVAKRLDACALTTALDAADSSRQSDTRQAESRILGHAPAAAITAPRQTGVLAADDQGSTDACESTAGTTTDDGPPFAAFLALDDVDADGNLGGRVIFARDFGARNELLRPSLGGRTWYTYKPRAPGDDTSAVLIPYERPAPGG